MVENLWGDIHNVEKTQTPVTILKEQAAKLGELTQRLLEGKVAMQSSSPDSQVANLYIIAPALGGYSVHILQVSHGLEMYPVRVYNMLTGLSMDPKTETEFTDTLATFFRDEKVRKVINSLLVQIKSAT